MTKNIFNLAIPISTLCIVDDKSCDSWHHPIERKWSVETGHVNVSDLLYLLYYLWTLWIQTLAQIFCNMIRSIPNKDWVSHCAIFLVWLLQIILLTAYLPPLSAGR